MLGRILICLTLFLFNTSVYCLSADDNLASWSIANPKIKYELCDLMAGKIDAMGNNKNLNFYGLCACINEVAKEPSLHYAKISEIAANCAILIK